MLQDEQEASNTSRGRRKEGNPQGPSNIWRVRRKGDNPQEAGNTWRDRRREGNPGCLEAFIRKSTKNGANQSKRRVERSNEVSTTIRKGEFCCG